MSHQVHLDKKDTTTTNISSLQIFHRSTFYTTSFISTKAEFSRVYGIIQVNKYDLLLPSSLLAMKGLKQQEEHH